MLHAWQHRRGNIERWTEVARVPGAISGITNQLTQLGYMQGTKLTQVGWGGGAYRKPTYTCHLQSSLNFYNLSVTSSIEPAPNEPFSPSFYSVIPLLALPLRSISSFPAASPEIYHNMKNLAFNSLLKWTTIILPIHATLFTHFSLKGWENVLLERGSERAARLTFWGWKRAVAFRIDDRSATSLYR